MKIGDVVLCINDIFSPEAAKKFQTLPIKGRNYLIRKLRNLPNGKIGILLEEIVNPKIEGSIGIYWEPDFDSERFSPQTTPSIEKILKELEHQPIYI
jgi:hypothetical protein